MRRTIKIALFIAILLGILSFSTSCTSCANSDKKQSETSKAKVKVEFPIQLNYNEDYPVKDIDLKEIADVEYVTFDKNVLLDQDAGSMSFSMSEQYIILSNKGEGTIFIFDRSGHLINKFNKKGKARGEYQRLGQLIADFNNRELFAFNHPFTYQILVYSFEGKFKRSFKIPQSLWMGEQVIDYNNEYLLANFRVSSTLKHKKNDNIYNYFISKSDGKFTPANIVSKGYIGSSVMLGYTKPLGRGPGMMPFGVKTNIFPIAKNGSEILLSDFGSDTIYISKGDRKLTPFIIKSPPLAYYKTPSFEETTQKGEKYFFDNSQEPILVSATLKTTKYTFVEKVIQREEDRQEKTFVIDNYTGEIFQANIISKDNDMIFTGDKEEVFLHDFYTHSPRSTQNCLICKCSTIKHIERNEKGLLKGELKEFASTLDEDDNDFFAIIKFKD